MKLLKILFIAASRGLPMTCTFQQILVFHGNWLKPGLLPLKPNPMPLAALCCGALPQMPAK